MAVTTLLGLPIPQMSDSVGVTIPELASAMQIIDEKLGGSRIVDHNLDVANPPNGYYMRGEDGWQVCFIVKSWQQSVDIPFSSFFITQVMTWHYPASFVEVPAMAGCAYMGEGNAPRWLGAGTSNILSQWNFWVMSTAIGESTTQGARLIAIGRWK